MAIVEMQDLYSRIKGKMGEVPSDEDISLLEDFTDTFTSLSKSESENWKAKFEKSEAEWKEKYDSNDAAWRKRYTDRFMGKVEDIPEVKDSLEKQRAETITIDDLFTEKE